LANPESESLRAILERGREISGSEHAAAIDRIWQLRNRSDEVFGDADFLVTPTSAAMPWPCEEPYPATIASRAASPRAHAVFTGFVNVLGLPAIALPARSTSEGLPIGIQLIARYGEEEALLNLAAAYEREFSWAHEWPPIA